MKNHNFSRNLSPIGMQGDIQDQEPGEGRKHGKFISLIIRRQEQEPLLLMLVLCSRHGISLHFVILHCFVCGETGGSRE